MADGYSQAGWVAAHTAILGLFDDTEDPVKIKLYDNSESPVQLGEFVIDYGSCTVGSNGAITIAILTQEDAALAGGTASYITLCDSSGTVVYKMSCQQGTAAVSGKCVMTTLSIIQGTPLEIISCTIPPGPTYS